MEKPCRLPNALAPSSSGTSFGPRPAMSMSSARRRRAPSDSSVVTGIPRDPGHRRSRFRRRVHGRPVRPKDRAHRAQSAGSSGRCIGCISRGCPTDDRAQPERTCARGASNASLSSFLACPCRDRCSRLRICTGQRGTRRQPDHDRAGTDPARAGQLLQRDRDGLEVESRPLLRGRGRHGRDVHSRPGKPRAQHAGSQGRRSDAPLRPVGRQSARTRDPGHARLEDAKAGLRSRWPRRCSFPRKPRHRSTSCRLRSRPRAAHHRPRLAKADSSMSCIRSRAKP